MAGEIIRQGDPTSHGGTVLEGSIKDICHGKPIAYIGHKVSCPLCKGTFPIIEGVLTTTFYGKGVALAGMKTACGASLVATQFTDTVSYAGGTGGAGKSIAPESNAAESVSSAAAVVAPSTPDQGRELPPKGDGKKRVTSLTWSYGANQIPVTEISRFYVDLNLHIQTENYVAGEAVEISIQDDQGGDVAPGIKKIDIRACVDATGSAKVMNAFASTTIITLNDQEVV